METKLRIGLFGYGMVGEALANNVWRKTDHILYVNDNAKGFAYHEQEIHDKYDCAFLCLPAPTLDHGNVDLSTIEKVLNEIQPSYPIFIKSTLPIGTCDKLTTKYKCSICHVPEFLTERTRFDDFNKQDIIMGHPDGMDHFQVKPLKDLIEKIFPNKFISVVKNKEAELIKYAHNCFGALKVTYYNFINQLCEQNKLDYEKVRSGTLISGLISPNHTLCPGPDGMKGYGGACFPKDMKAFVHYNKTKNQNNGNQIRFSTFNEVLDLCIFLNKLNRK